MKPSPPARNQKLFDMDIDIFGALKFGSVAALVMAVAYLVFAVSCGYRNQRRNRRKNEKDGRG